MTDLWQWIDSNENLTLKEEMAFSAVMHCVMTSVALDYDMNQTEKLAVAQGSLFKQMQQTGGEKLHDLLWKRENGMSVNEFVDNVIELYTYVVINLHEELGDENLIYFVNDVKRIITERGQ